MSLLVSKVHKDSSGFYYIDEGKYVTSESVFPVNVVSPIVEVYDPKTNSTTTMDFTSTFKTAMYKINLGLQGRAGDLLKRLDTKSPITQFNPPHLDDPEGTVYWSQGKTTTRDFLRTLYLIANDKKEDNKLVVPSNWCPKSITPTFEGCPTVATSTIPSSSLPVSTMTPNETKQATNTLNYMVFGGISGVLCIFCVLGVLLIIVFKKNA